MLVKGGPGGLPTHEEVAMIHKIWTAILGNAIWQENTSEASVTKQNFGKIISDSEVFFMAVDGLAVPGGRPQTLMVLTKLGCRRHFTMLNELSKGVIVNLKFHGWYDHYDLTAVNLKRRLFVMFLSGSGRETVAVLLPGFAINW